MRGHGPMQFVQARKKRKKYITAPVVGYWSKIDDTYRSRKLFSSASQIKQTWDYLTFVYPNHNEILREEFLWLKSFLFCKLFTYQIERFAFANALCMCKHIYMYTQSEYSSMPNKSIHRSKLKNSICKNLLD